jgi:DNA-binding transcriptional regulator YiaG
MSTKLSLKEALGRRERTEAARQEPSDIPRIKLLLVADQITRPVAVALFLYEHGLSLKKAHNVLGRIAAGPVPVELIGDLDEIVSKLRALGVLAAPIRAPQADLKQIRERLDLTQTEFATLYDIDVDTLQNWEQGRNIPDTATMHFYQFVQAFPALSMELATGGMLPSEKLGQAGNALRPKTPRQKQKTRT